ncbi:unnamed protein product [Closterium sp. Naga37s-1]|nr:unnamed protein product [Closterium sp. Naga37s-1]
MHNCRWRSSDPIAPCDPAIIHRSARRPTSSRRVAVARCPPFAHSRCEPLPACGIAMPLLFLLLLLLLPLPHSTAASHGSGGGAAARLNGLAEDPLADDDSFARLAEADKRRWAQGAAEDAGLAAKMRRLAEVKVVTRVHVRLVGFDGDRDDNSNLRVQPVSGGGGEGGGELRATPAGEADAGEKRTRERRRDGGQKGGGDPARSDARSGAEGVALEEARGVCGEVEGERPSAGLLRLAPFPVCSLTLSPHLHPLYHACPLCVLTTWPPMPPRSLTCTLHLPAAAMPCHGGRLLWGGGIGVWVGIDVWGR